MKKTNQTNHYGLKIGFIAVSLVLISAITVLSAQDGNQSTQQEYLYYLETTGEPIYVKTLNGNEVMVRYGWSNYAYMVKLGGLSSCYYPEVSTNDHFGDAIIGSYVNHGQRYYCMQQSGNFYYYQDATTVTIYDPNGMGCGNTSGPVIIAGLYGIFKDPQSGKSCIAFFSNDATLSIGVLQEKNTKLLTFKGNFHK